VTDPTGILVGLLALVGVLAAAIVSALVALGIALLRYLAKQHLLELWNRQLVDHIYRQLPPPPPPAPEGLYD
jgi:hypothetical protein